MTSRHLTTAVTMIVLIGILVLGVVVGVRELFAPLPGSEGATEEETTAATETCDPDATGKRNRLTSRQVTVNVFNGGTRAGLASQTLDTLTARGFRAGEAANASDTGVRRVQVWIVEGEEAAGKLVARNFGPRVPVKTVQGDKDLGDGVDVVVGNRLGALPRPVRSIRVKADQAVCP
jgi:hypothetical protein